MTGSHSWRRRGLPLLGGAVLLLSLAACGDDSTSSGATTVVSGGATTTAAASGGSTTTAAAAGGASTTAGSSAEWDKVVEAAKKEGKVTIYSSQGLDQLNDFAAKFKDEYGIPVEVVRGIDGDLLAKVEAEKQTGNGIADMWVSASQSTVDAKAKEGGWFLPAGGPSFDSPDYDKAYYKPGDYFEVGAAILTFGWNTQLFPKGLKDYTDLLDPELGGGKIGVIEPTAPSIVDFYLYLEENYGADFVQKLASQEPRIYPSSLPMGQALTSGEIAAGSFVQVQNDPKAKGAPVDSGLAPEAWGARFFGSLLATGPHPNAAQLLANFMLTPEGQEAVMHNASSVFPDIPGTVTSDDKVREQDLSKLTPETVKAYQEKWNSMFK
jgi:iron(III) transport system substrate-binding protein